MTFEIAIERKIVADGEFVFDWWTDLTPDDAKLVRPLKSRRIISRTPELVLLEDEEQMYFKKMKYNVRVTLERPKSWVSEYEGKDALARSEYVLKPHGDYTVLNYHTKIQPKGFFTNAFSFLVKPFIKRIFAGEFKIFISKLEEDYRTKAKFDERSKFLE
jgi:hypothetical protein